MTTTMWRLPVPATRVTSHRFVQVGGRHCELTVVVLDDDDTEKSFVIAFDGVEAFRCTYLTSLTAEMVKSAYGKLVRQEASSWLEEVLQAYSAYYESSGRSPERLMHTIICLDDGPCYEVICTSLALP